MTLSKSEVLPEQQLELKEESHLGLLSLGLGLGLLSLGLGLGLLSLGLDLGRLSLNLLFNPLLSFAFWSL